MFFDLRIYTAALFFFITSSVNARVTVMSEPAGCVLAVHEMRRVLQEAHSDPHEILVQLPYKMTPSLTAKLDRNSPLKVNGGYAYPALIDYAEVIPTQGLVESWHAMIKKLSGSYLLIAFDSQEARAEYLQETGHDVTLYDGTSTMDGEQKWIVLLNLAESLRLAVQSKELGGPTQESLPTTYSLNGFNDLLSALRSSAPQQKDEESVAEPRLARLSHNLLLSQTSISWFQDTYLRPLAKMNIKLIETQLDALGLSDRDHVLNSLRLSHQIDDFAEGPPHAETYLRFVSFGDNEPAIIFGAYETNLYHDHMIQLALGSLYRYAEASETSLAPYLRGGVIRFAYNSLGRIESAEVIVDRITVVDLQTNQPTVIALTESAKERIERSIRSQLID